MLPYLVFLLIGPASADSSVCNQYTTCQSCRNISFCNFCPLDNKCGNDNIHLISKCNKKESCVGPKCNTKACRFGCPALPEVPAPKDITELHPSHVSIVMAAGDSITAAFSARSSLTEARDISWSIGKGDAAHITLPFLLEQYSPTKVEGQSTKAVIPADITDLPKRDYHPKTDHMNVAESEGAAHRGSLDEQWKYLLSNFGKYTNFTSRWKVLTIWMMANDVCGQCDRPAEQNGEYKQWEAKMDEFLGNVTSTLTNTYVNLVSTLDLSNIARIQRSRGGLCTFEHKHVLKECGCIDRGNSTELAMLDSNIHYMNNRQHKFAADWGAKLKQRGRQDMAIVEQAFLEGIGGTLDWHFLSTLDCFHPSTFGHQDLAIGLWNSMLCTGDRKNRCGEIFTPDIKVTCPTEKSVFYTGPDVVPNPPVPPAVLV